MTARRKRCPICQSREWHKEPASGLITCSEGHVLQNYINENHETTEIGPHAMRKRTIKSQRQRDDAEERSAADPKIYHGLKGRYLYFQCLQLILRKQIAVIMREWNLPRTSSLKVTVNQIICRDLWALHLLLLRNPPPPEPWVFLQEQEDKQKHDLTFDNPLPSASSQGTDCRVPKGVPVEYKGKDISGGGDSSDSDDNIAPAPTHRESADAELAALLREASESSSSSSEDEGASLPGNEGSSKPTTKRHQKNRYELPISTLAVIVLACWTMRLPIIYMDIIRLVEAYTLPYLEAIRFLPDNMRFAPSALALHRVTSRLAHLSHERYGAFFPELNAAPVLWRAVRSLLGTPTLYFLSKSLSTILSLPLTLHPSLSPQLKRRKKSDPKHRYGDNIPPELSLIATVIIVIKMVYGLDDKAPLVPVEPNDAAFTMPEASEYFQALRSHYEDRFRTSSELFSPRSSLTALDLDVRQIDAYLEFCEKALLLPVGAEGRDKRHTQQNSNPSTAERRTPASYHKIYTSHDVTGTFPADYALVLDIAARWVGAGREDVGTIVGKLEKRARLWWKAKKRQMRDMERGILVERIQLKRDTKKMNGPMAWTMLARM
ncbi:hypothetical protein BS47DRAFT_1370896 [Hydnum rufescens UP504]|uniref:RRN7-type domain-containing protein n=1 Tax=Hydnum rufescens UP504 TaxID=1448309 RepID=A0A9P6B7L7_9AGAM|nr:hypothetical protein BS47DRAFT_1370896 [Hydnum rufescens UP504]